MSATGLEVFDRTLQTTHIWLDDIKEMLGPDRQVAWKVLSVVLRKLRDRLPIELAANLGAQLPLLVRGAYYDQFEPQRQPMKLDRDRFVAEVGNGLSDSRPIDAEEAVRAVFVVLSSHLPQGQIAKVQHALPEPFWPLWQPDEAEAPPPPDRTA